MTPQRFARIIVKALILFVLFDIFQAAVHLDRRVESLSIYRYLVPPLSRIDIMRDYPTPVMWRLRPLLDAHQIALPKKPDEYRVAVLGDSGTFGMFTPSRQAIPGQMTALHAQLPGGTVVAYNLAYQTPNTLKDVLLLHHLLGDHVDAVVWFVTLYDLAADQPPPARHFIHIIIRVNADELPALCREYGINTWETRELLRPLPEYRRSIIFTGARYRDYFLLLARSFLDRFAGGDPTESFRPKRPWIGGEPLPAEPLFREVSPNDPPMPNSRWTTLLAGVRMAKEKNIPVLVVNEPMFIASGPHADHEYNSFYGKKIYDRYRAALARFCRENRLNCLDLWNAVPPGEMDDTPEHYTPAGNARIAAAVVARLREMAEK